MIDTTPSRWPISQPPPFRFTRGPLAELSNFYPELPFRIGPLRVRTSEALYQAFKFPRHPDIQLKIISAATPGAAKHLARSHAEAEPTPPRHARRSEATHQVACPLRQRSSGRNDD